MKTVVLVFTACWLVLGCGGKKDDKRVLTPAAPVDVKQTEKASSTPVDNGLRLMVTQSNFTTNEKGLHVVPDSGELIILTPQEKGKMWKEERILDSESNVIHKAIQYDDQSIVTIGAVQALLKRWTRKNGKWVSETLWNPTFGGKTDRLRDFERVDVNGDGTDELAIATHDQGVVAVAWNRDGRWEVEEIDRQASIFVHEIEVGDMDHDGNMEIYATPSEPNTASGVGQGGSVVRYTWTGEGFERKAVVTLKTRHIKEILVADVDGDGKDEMYASLEAEMGENYAIEQPVEIVRYDVVDGVYRQSPVFTIDGERFCRFLVAGDLDGDGKTELVAAAFSKGVFVIKHDGGQWTATNIETDKSAGGFEHAAYVADMDGDGAPELYVADDNNGVLKQFVYDGGTYSSTVIAERLEPKSAMVWNITTARLP